MSGELTHKFVRVIAAGHPRFGDVGIIEVDRWDGESIWVEFDNPTDCCPFTRDELEILNTTQVPDE